MEAVQVQDLAGKDFDQWLDWNGNANEATGTGQPTTSANPPYLTARNTNDHRPSYPTSPSSTINGDYLLKHSILTGAPAVVDLPTPSRSSGSPEVHTSTDLRLSGDTCREYPAIASRPVLKRKLSAQDVPTNSNAFDDQEYGAAKPTNKKRPHNVIEKRYRANLNEKIAELRDSVPSLRVMKRARQQSGEDAGAGSSDNEEDLAGLAPSNKLNKASILTKAVEYIRHLELRTRRLDDENRALKERVQTLDKLLAQGGNGAQRAAAFTQNCVVEADPTRVSDAGDPSKSEKTNISLHPSQGLIPVPEAMRKLRENMPKEHYGHIYDTPSEGQRYKGKWGTRIMLGSLAGLMIMEGLGERDEGTGSKEKGLFGIPLELLDGYRFLRSPRVYLVGFAQFCRAGGVIPLIKGFTALTVLAFLVFAYLFNSKPPPSQQTEAKPVRTPQTPSPASPIEVRRRAWSTSMQTLRLPHHSFFAEWLAVTAEWLKYTVMYIFGANTYAWVTGRLGDEEIARIKAWDIAIDAQLAGGDQEISRSRVVLTSFGSGTLPRSPLRLMLKSLHCRVLMWGVGRPGTTSSHLANSVARFFANREWRKARQLHASLSAGHNDRLPPYLATLLEQECEDVFLDSVVQRAYNLMYDRPTSDHAEDALMDVVVEDHAVRSPLEALAAWWSIQALRKALVASLTAPELVEHDEHLKGQIELALAVAPPGSAAQTRAYSVHAVFYSDHRQDYYARAASALPRRPSSAVSSLRLSGLPCFIDSSTPASARPEIFDILRCARVMILIENDKRLREGCDGGCDGDDDDVRRDAIALLTASSTDPSAMTILSFAAVYFVLKHLLEHEGEDASEQMSFLATSSSVTQNLRSWLRTNNTDASVASNMTIPRQVQETVEAWSIDDASPQPLGKPGTKRRQRRQSNLSNDTGYASQDEDDGCDPSPSPSPWLPGRRPSSSLSSSSRLTSSSPSSPRMSLSMQCLAMTMTEIRRDEQNHHHYHQQA